MKFPFLAATLLVFGSLCLPAQEGELKAGAATNLPPDPFKDLKPEPEAEEYAMEVDRTRGNLFIAAKDGKYIPGSHFANWQWTLDAKRWGRYYAVLRYTSMEPKMGVQLKVGDSMVKSYAPRSGGHKDHQIHELVMGFVYIPKAGEYPVNLLTGDKSNGPNFYVKGVRFMPAPEAEMHSVGQGIDGTINLDAKTASTYAEMMRYEPKEEKNCLGYWVDENDWAEWKFEVSSPGKFKLEVYQGCGKGQGRQRSRRSRQWSDQEIQGRGHRRISELESARPRHGRDQDPRHQPDRDQAAQQSGQGGDGRAESGADAGGGVIFSFPNPVSPASRGRGVRLLPRATPSSCFP